MTGCQRHLWNPLYKVNCTNAKLINEQTDGDVTNESAIQMVSAVHNPRNEYSNIIWVTPTHLQGILKGFWHNGLNILVAFLLKTRTRTVQKSQLPDLVSSCSGLELRKFSYETSRPTCVTYSNQPIGIGHDWKCIVCWWFVISVTMAQGQPNWDNIQLTALVNKLIEKAA